MKHRLHTQGDTRLPGGLLTAHPAGGSLNVLGHISHRCPSDLPESMCTIWVRGRHYQQPSCCRTALPPPSRLQAATFIPNSGPPSFQTSMYTDSPAARGPANPPSRRQPRGPHRPSSYEPPQQPAQKAALPKTDGGGGTTGSSALANPPGSAGPTDQGPRLAGPAAPASTSSQGLPS